MKKHPERRGCMRRYLEELKDFTKKCDWVLLIMLLIVSGFGCVCIASATSAEKFEGSIRYIILQLVAIGLGVVIFAMISSIGRVSPPGISMCPIWTGSITRMPMTRW